MAAQNQGNISKKTARIDSQAEKDNMQFFKKNGELKLKSLVSLPVAASITDVQGILREVNDAFCQFSGYSQQELLGKHLSMLVAKPAELKHEQDDASWELRTKSGDTRFVQCSTTFITNNKKQVYKLSCITDITHLKQSEQQYRQTIKDLNDSLETQENIESMFLHDVRKPISNILGICQLLNKTPFDEAKFEKWIKILELEAGKSIQLLEAKADFRRMEMDTYQPNRTDFDLIQMIHRLLAPLQPRINECSLTILFSLEGAPCQPDDFLIISADELFVEIMLNNLIMNALEASPERAAVRIELFVKNKRALQTDIYNKGAIPLAIRHRFFNKYATYGKAKGLGMGAYTAKTIAKAHGGDITYFTSEDEGTILQVFLPGVIKDTNRTQHRRDHSSL